MDDSHSKAGLLRLLELHFVHDGRRFDKQCGPPLASAFT
jgi:hypothetical protein